VVMYHCRAAREKSLCGARGEKRNKRELQTRILEELYMR